MSRFIDSVIDDWGLTEGRQNESGCQCYTGWANSAESVHDWIIRAYTSRVWEQELAWCDAYRHVWISVSLRATLTYCEGDLILLIAPESESFYNELASSSRFYKDN
jgi:hypothetical protein